MHIRTVLLTASIVILATACRKDEVFTDDPGAQLTLTVDTVLFDTIFTTVGSVTKRFTVHNDNDNAVRVDIALEGGTPSPFRINVDGASGVTFNDVEILGHDSIFIFVEATLGENNANDPFIFEDHILLNTNGNEQSVLLLAWGQDAHFYFPDQHIQGLPAFSYIAGGYDQNGNQICETVQWQNDKPYVIYGYAVVDSCCALVIDPGVKVYFHGGGGLWVYKHGRIEANGEVNDRITFQGDRLEAMYEGLPNQWDRIWINEGAEGQDNVLRNCVIKNALIGVQAQTLPWTDDQPLSPNKLWLDNVRISNCFTAGLYTENYRIKATNLQVNDAGQYAVVLTGDGQYEFDQITIANYWSFDIRNDPAFLLTNKFVDATGATQVRTIQAGSTFKNGIIHGSNGNEFKLDLDESTDPQFMFSYFLFRTDQPTNDASHFDQATTYRNLDPGFVDGPAGDLHLKANSSARGKADPVVSLFLDLDGEPRPNTTFGPEDNFKPDLGCYEYRE
ncbi:MAG TPA: hypothetical protein PKE53_05130 [Flavobacteriales bacterium]|nr:hypothetical protein [Flavobacteriales bacterium]MCC6653964.1 hypothetical protein [Flavobacteriales bacterium]HMU13365.1 hypothetical protein [Flavobacteriales bacterium]HNI03407.1 hypothetical protein [Flavobacteriales bacterium]HNK67896.1 hypothetical protein [Flavobacteriales bacterium]